ncbi:regulator of Vps4 activity in the MVB pathway-domain-containing protein [Mucidula mucida]|nr:regulator of Vps4 activity in the MVB pathway-domain-containing protein [Mucidula mucida]
MPRHRISVQRLRMLQQKKEAQAKMSRRDIATLIERGKLETARVKVETIINEDIHIELLELLELYCELLVARFGILDMNSREPDPAVAEGVCAIIYAAPRTELKELHVLRDILMHKYGRDFSASVMENADNCVNERIVRKLDISMPSSELVNAYLTEIAKSYGVPWSQPGSNDAGDGTDEGGAKATEVDRTESAPGNVDADLTLPEIPPAEEKSSDSSKNVVDSRPTPPKSPPAPESTEDDFEALNKRFAALKKR